MPRRGSRKGGGAKPPVLADIADASFTEETRKRYLNYALSVITSRALPDVRDGLKPVQRRILYTMYHELRLRHDARYRKSAAIVGDVMGKFHPHGDGAIYDALVRMAQDFTLAAPLVDGRGNFGSPDGDGAAAMRYTEAKLQPLAEHLLMELDKQVVSTRPNYDGTREEPTVLPSRFPHLLVNGSQGIAVGMATAIPPHHLGEVIDACIASIDTPDIDVRTLLQHMRGPDFPTGGELQASKQSLTELYEKGQGSLKLRGEWHVEDADKQAKIIITSIPYGIERRVVVEKIADAVLAKKLPQLVDVRDESDAQCRVVCELKKGADPELAIAYIYKHTPLESNVHVNLTVLVPTAQHDVAAPQRVGLPGLIRHFLDFRFEVITKRLEYDLAALRRRIHILEGFARVFDALDETIAIIRNSEGRSDAAKQLMTRFELDEDQVNAILDLRLYKLARLEILVIQKELAEKRKQADALAALLQKESPRWQLIRDELSELKAQFAIKRRTRILAHTRNVPSYDADAFIVDEDVMVLVTQQGWIKRQQRIRDLQATRLRDGDRVLAVQAGSTRHALALFSNRGSCYVMRMVDVPASTGFGVAIQTLVRMQDGERIVTALSMDPRFLEVPELDAETELEQQTPHLCVVTKLGQCLRLSLRAYRDTTTRAGKRYCRLRDDDEVIAVQLLDSQAQLSCMTRQGHTLSCAATDISLLGGVGKGVTLIKLGQGDEVMGAIALNNATDVLKAVHQSGKVFTLKSGHPKPSRRGGKGHALFKRGRINEVQSPEIVIPVFPTDS